MILKLKEIVVYDLGMYMREENPGPTFLKGDN